MLVSGPRIRGTTAPPAPVAALVSLGRMTPIPATAVARSRTLGEARWSPGGARLAWLDAFGGRVDLVVAAADGSTPAVTLTAAVPVTPLGAYGGGGYCWAGDDTLVYAAADGRLVVIDVDGGGRRVLSRDGRAAAPTVAPGGDRVAFVLERDDACDVAVVPLDGSDWPRRLSHADYAWDPAWSADGTRLAWHEWDLPNMPWDGSRIMRVAPDCAQARAVCRRRRRRRGRPAPVLAHRRHAGVRVGSRRVDERVARPR